MGDEFFSVVVSRISRIISHFCGLCHVQSRHQWIQERSLEYSRDQLLLAGFLDHLHKFAKKTLVNDEGHVDASCIKRSLPINKLLVFFTISSVIELIVCQLHKQGIP